MIELATSAERYATVLTLPFQGRHLRRTVWVMLSAWSLALMAGIANACRLRQCLLAPSRCGGRFERLASHGPPLVIRFLSLTI